MNRMKIFAPVPAFILGYTAKSFYQEPQSKDSRNFIADAVEKTIDSVVNIKSTTQRVSLFESVQEHTSGSGFFVDENGSINY